MISVLLVEPHEDTRDLYAAVLQSFGFRVLTAANTDAACALVPDADVLVTGLQVPGRFDGIGLIHWVRSRTSSRALPIVVVTACAEPSHRQSAEAAGCNAFLTKPCLPIDLVTEIRHAAMSCSGSTVMAKATVDRRRHHRSREGTHARRSG